MRFEFTRTRRHAQLERGKVIDVGIHIYIYMCVFVDQTFFWSIYSDRLTFQHSR